MNFDKGRVVYMNGQYVHEKMKISIFDSAFVWRYGFEMTRSFNKQHLN